MPKRAATVTTSEVSRVVRGALRAGLPAGSFEVRVEGSVIRLLPAGRTPELDDPMEIERRIREGCGTS